LHIILDTCYAGLFLGLTYVAWHNGVGGLWTCSIAVILAAFVGVAFGALETQKPFPQKCGVGPRFIYEVIAFIDKHEVIIDLISS